MPRVPGVHTAAMARMRKSEVHNWDARCSYSCYGQDQSEPPSPHLGFQGVRTAATARIREGKFCHV